MNDAEEGRTIFVRDVSFDCDEQQLTEYFSEQCGPVQQCKIVKDRLTEHSRGQAFVKFRQKSDADACLLRWASNNQCYQLLNRRMQVCLAVTKEKLGGVKRRTDSDGSGVKRERVGVGVVGGGGGGGGKRNLHLARVGQIRRGSKEAADVPEGELQLREQLEARSREALKNTDVFVSPVRLCVHNLPSELDDRQLRRAFLSLGGQDARITECRIMRDTSKAEKLAPGAKVAGRSRGFAFVAFGDHEHALRAATAANAGPVLAEGFTKRRLIVQFSLERLSALRKKQQLVSHVPKPDGVEGGVPKAPKRRARHLEAAKSAQREQRQSALKQKQQRLSRAEFRRRRKEALIRDGRLSI